MYCFVKTKNGIIEAINRVELRRKIKQLTMDVLTNNAKLRPNQIHKMKVTLVQFATQLFEQEVSKRGLTSSTKKKELFAEMFFNPDITKNALTAIPSKENPNTVIGMLGTEIQKLSEPGSQQTLAHVIKALRYTASFENNDVFQNSLVIEILKDFKQRGYYVNLELTTDQTSETTVEKWQKDINTISQYESLSEELKSALNNIKRKKFDSKGNLVDAKGFLGLPEVHTFSYAYKRLIQLLGNSGTSRNMMRKINELRTKDPLIAELFPEDMTSNEAQKFQTLIWAKIASNYKYDYFDTVITNKNGEMIREMNPSNYENNDKSIYSDVLRTAREGKLIANGTYDGTQRNSLIGKLDKAFGKDGEALAEALEEFGLFTYTLGSDPSTEDFKEKVFGLYNTLKSKDEDGNFNGDLLGVNGKPSSAFLLYTQMLSENSLSIMNNSHLNSKGEKVYQFNNSNFTTRQISRIQNGENIYKEDPLYDENKTIEAIANKQAAYLVVNGIRLPGKRKLIAYSDMNKQQLVINQLIMFNERRAIELPIHSDSGSMTAIRYNRKFIKNGQTDRLEDGTLLYTPNESIIDDLLKLAKNELSVINNGSLGSNLHIFPELQAYIGENLSDTNLKVLIKDIMVKRAKDYEQYLIDEGVFKVHEYLRKKTGVLKRTVVPTEEGEALKNYGRKEIRDFVYNYAVLYPSAAITFNGHPNFYEKAFKGDTSNLSEREIQAKDVLATLANYDKRTKQIWSPTTPLFVGAYYTSPYSGDVTTVSENYVIQGFKDIEGITEGFQEHIRKLEEHYAGIDGRYDGITEIFKSSSLTDGQSYIDPFRYKQILIGLGEWNDTKEFVYLKMLQGEFNFQMLTPNQKESFFNPLKGFHFSMIEGTQVKPFQKKDSELVMHPMHGVRFLKNGEPNTYYNPLYRLFLERMGYEFTENSVKTIPNFEKERSYNHDRKYIDTFSSNEALKAEQGGILDLDQNIVTTSLKFNSSKFDYDLDNKLRNKLKELFPDINLEYVDEILASYDADVFNQVINRLDKLNDFLTKLNFNVKTVDELRTLTGFNALATTDLIYKTILLKSSSDPLRLLTKEVAYVAYSMLGKKNKIRTDLVSSIENIQGYAKAYDRYKKRSPDLNDYKIKELIVVDYISAAIENNFENPSKVELGRSAEYWSIQGNSKLEKQIKYQLNRLKRFIKELLGSNKLNSTEVNDLLDDIASDVINSEFKKFGTVLSSDQQLTEYQQTINEDPKADSIVKDFQELGILLTGSLSLRKQGTIYRSEKETLHDLDFTVPYSLIQADLSLIQQNRNAEISAAEKEFSYVPDLRDQIVSGIYKKYTGISDNLIYNSEWFKAIKKKYPSLKKVRSFGGTKNETFTWTGSIEGGYDIDLFLTKDNRLGVINNDGFQDWISIFKAKLKMGRAKDLRDFANYIPFNTNNDKFSQNVGLRHFNFEDIQKSNQKPESDQQNVFNQNESGKIVGQAIIDAKKVLIDAVNQKQDTLPHEYAHHYIAMFRNTPIVQEGLKRWGSEEALVQAIGEQVVVQKGEALNWWNKFVNFIFELLSDKEVLQVLTDSFLQAKDLNTISRKFNNPSSVINIIQDVSEATPDPGNNNTYDVESKGKLYGRATSSFQLSPAQKAANDYKSSNEDINELTRLLDDYFNNSFKSISNYKIKNVDKVNSYLESLARTKTNLRSSSKLGTSLDNLVRDFFSDDLKDLNSYNLANRSLVKSFLESLKELKAKLEANGETVVANGILLHNDKMGIAGTVDLLTYDKEGNFSIYDLKSMKVNNDNEIVDGRFVAVHSGTKKLKYDTAYKQGELSNRKKHENQLNIYSMLLFNQYGIRPTKLGIIPVGLSYDAKEVVDGAINPLTRLTMLKGISVSMRDSVKGLNKEFTYEDKKPTQFARYNPSALTVKNEDYGKQNDVPSGFLDNKKSLSRQAGKNMAANVNPEASYTIAKYTSLDKKGNLKIQGSQTLTGAKLLEKINRLEIQEIIEAYAEVTNQVKDFKGIIATIKAEVSKRGLSNNYLEALQIITDENNELRTLAPLDFPAYSHKIKQIINSIYSKQVTNPKKLQGVGLVNASSAGFTEDTRPKIVFKEDSKGNKLENIDYIEALMPIHDSRLYKYVKPNVPLDRKAIEDLIKKNPELEDVFKGLIWRTPNEAKYSTAPIKIIGFIPTSIGSAVYLPTEITDIAGLDFDIDKMYGFFYSFVSRGYDDPKMMDKVIDKIKENAKKAGDVRGFMTLEELIRDNPMYVFQLDMLAPKNSNKGYYPLLKYIYELNTTYQEDASKDLTKREQLATQNIMTAYTEVLKDEPFHVPRGDSKVGRQNQLIDAYRALMSSSDAAFETLNPSSIFDRIFNDLEIKLGIDDNIGTMGMPSRSVESRSNALDGTSLVGPLANANSTISIFQQAKTLKIASQPSKDEEGNAILKEDGTPETYEVGFKFNLMEGRKENKSGLYNDFTNRGIILDELNYRFRSQNISLWLAAIVDNTKNPHAGKLNLNFSTVNVLIAMLSAGVDFNTAMYFINHPALRYYSKRFKFDGGTRMSNDKAFGDMMDLIMTDDNGDPRDATDKEKKRIAVKSVVNFEKGDLLKSSQDGISDPKEWIMNNKKEAFDVMTTFSRYIEYGEYMRKLTVATKSTEDGIGSSDGESISMILKIIDAINDPNAFEGAVELLLDDTKPYYYLTKLLIDLDDNTKANTAREVIKDHLSRSTKSVVKDGNKIKDVMMVVMENLGIPAYNRGVYFNMIYHISNAKSKVTGNQLTGREIEIILHDFKTFVATLNNEDKAFFNTFVSGTGDETSITEGIIERFSKHPEYSELLNDFIIQKDKEGTQEFMFYKSNNNEIAEEEHMKEDMMSYLYLEDPKLVQDLARYALYLDGLGYSPFGYTKLIPQQAFADLGYYSDESNSIKLSLSEEHGESSYDNQLMISTFLMQHLANNANASYIARLPKEGPDGYVDYYYDSNNGDIYVKRKMNNGDINYDIKFSEIAFRFEASKTDMVQGKHFKLFNLEKEIITRVKLKVKKKAKTTDVKVEDVNKENPNNKKCN